MSKIIIDALTSSISNKIGFSLSKPFCSIFMLHRFAVPDEQISGHSADFLKKSLEYLRKEKFTFLSAEDVTNHLLEKRPFPKRSVCFTLDDGFWDQASVSAPIFSQYDCPATYYLVTRFIDQKIWMWDSKLEYLFENSTESSLTKLAQTIATNSGKPPASANLFNTLIDKLKRENLNSIDQLLATWATTLEIDLPAEAPVKYRAMSWNDAQSLIKLGQKVGPHSVTHPILANETDEESERQINQSWLELKTKIPEASDVFCYPVGRYGKDFGQREMEFVARSEMRSAHAADPGYIEAGKHDTITALKRYGFPDTMKDLKQYATWLERAKDITRSRK